MLIPTQKYNRGLHVVTVASVGVPARAAIVQALQANPSVRLVRTMSLLRATHPSVALVHKVIGVAERDIAVLSTVPWDV